MCHHINYVHFVILYPTTRCSKNQPTNQPTSHKTNLHLPAHPTPRPQLSFYRAVSNEDSGLPSCWATDPPFLLYIQNVEDSSPMLKHNTSRSAAMLFFFEKCRWIQCELGIFWSGMVGGYMNWFLAKKTIRVILMKWQYRINIVISNVKLYT